MRRTLAADAGRKEAPESSKATVDRLFGNEEWRQIYRAQRDGVIKGEDAWIHYVEQYRLGLTQLGYDYTSAIEVRNTNRVVLYHMVFATSHGAGEKIMRAVQKKARAILPAMVEEERRNRSQIGPKLFDESDADLARYANEPSKWAQFFDDAPLAFDPSRFATPPVAEQLDLGVGFDMSASTAC